MNKYFNVMNLMMCDLALASICKQLRLRVHRFAHALAITASIPARKLLVDDGNRGANVEQILGESLVDSSAHCGLVQPCKLLVLLNERVELGCSPRGCALS